MMNLSFKYLNDCWVIMISWSLCSNLFRCLFFLVLFGYSLHLDAKEKNNCSSQLTLMVLWEVVSLSIKTFSKFFDTKTYNVLPSLLIFDFIIIFGGLFCVIFITFFAIEKKFPHLITLLHVMPIMCIIFVVNS